MPDGQEEGQHAVCAGLGGGLLGPVGWRTGEEEERGGGCWLRGRLLLCQVVDELVNVMMLLKFARGSSGGGSV